MTTDQIWLANGREERRLAQEENNEIGEFEYEADNRVFLIEDGERHWYVATNAGTALVEHISLMDPDDSSEFTVSPIDPNRQITVSMECLDDCKGFPPTFVILGPAPHCDEESGGYGIRARASEWAKHEGAGHQIASSCFP
jgi:hypothetical protein